MSAESPVLDRLEGAAEALRGLANGRVVRVLGRAGRRFLDPGDPLRREALARIPDEAGLSGPMARLLLDRMAGDWAEDALERLLGAEFRDPGVLEGFREGAAGDRTRALGDRLAFHLCAGNVAGVGATSLVRSLLVRSPVLLKPGQGDVVLPTLLERAIREEDPVLGAAAAVRYWRGGTPSALEDEALERAGRVVVYGGAGVIEAVRTRVGGRVPIVAYPHRISVGAVAREVAGRATARAAAAAVAAYDQRGCVSPHLVWVEEGGKTSPARWAELLGEELEALREALPKGPSEPEEAARHQQLRLEAELLGASGAGVQVRGGAGTSWTVVFEPEAEFRGGCAGRFVRVQPVEALEGLPSVLEVQAELLQSVGLAADAARREGLAEAFARAGVSRVTTFERQPWPPPWWTHDGQGPLRVLVRWSSLEE